MAASTIEFYMFVILYNSFLFVICFLSIDHFTVVGYLFSLTCKFDTAIFFEALTKVWLFNFIDLSSNR
jgi:hypothetical protein